MIPLHVELVRTTVGVFLPLFTYYCLSRYDNTQNIYYFKLNTLAISGQMIFDWTVYKYLNWDALFHHICVCGLLYSLFLTDALHHLPEIHSQVYATLQTEYSTLFLTIMSYLPTLQKKYDIVLLSWMTAFAQPVFMCVFAYTRLYQFPLKLVFDIKYVDYIYSLFTSYDAVIYSFSAYGLYFINIYWGGIILKKCMKPIHNWSIFQPIICENIMRYTMIIPTMISIYMYCSGGKWQNVYLLDIAGNALLSYSSHNYHTMLYNELIVIYPNINVDVLKDTNVWIYLDDICSINLRLFFSTYVFFVTRELGQGYIFMCGLTHALCMYLYIRYIIQLKLGGNAFSLEETKGYKSNVIYFLSGFPLLVDISCGLWFMDYLTSQKIILTYILSILTLYLRPMYHSSHLLFHIVICIKTYFTIQSVLSI
jgi:hypothetical protein